MRSAILTAILLLATPAFALFGTTLRVEVRDGQDRPAADGFVVARDIGYVGIFGQIHSSQRVCVSAGAATFAGGAAKIRLPAPAIRYMSAGRRRIEVIAYRPGHCASWSEDWRSGVTMRLPPAPGAADERLMYLQELTASLVCDGPWDKATAAAIEWLAKALDEETRPLVREPYERQLAERIRMNLRLARNRIVPEPHRDLAPGAPAEGFSRDFVVVREGSPARAVVRCRHGEPAACNLDQRDSRGETALGAAINLLDVDEVRALLAAGADPAVRTKPAGDPAIDMLLRRMARTSPSHSESDRALEILALLTAHPRVAISRWLKQDLATDPAQWIAARTTMGGPLFLRARETLAALPQRPDEAVLCPRLDPQGFDPTLGRFRLQ